MLENLSRRILNLEDGFEAPLFMINPSHKGLVYLKIQLLGSYMIMLIDIGVTSSSMIPECAKRLKVRVVDRAMPVKVNLVQGL